MKIRRAIALIACFLPAALAAAGCGQDKPGDPTHFRAYNPKVAPTPYAQAHTVGYGNFNASNIPPDKVPPMFRDEPSVKKAQQPH